MALTLTPPGPNTAVQNLVSIVSAAYDAPLSAAHDIPSSAATVVMLITLPDPRSAMRGSKAAVRIMGPLRFAAMTAAKVASSTCVIGSGGLMACIIHQDVDHVKRLVGCLHEMVDGRL
jgi:hypothetical protein